LVQITEICDLVKSQIKSRQLKSNPNQTTCFHKSVVLNSNKHVIQSWFTSNNDLDLPITAADDDHDDDDVYAEWGARL